jgi:hypothetical protein
VGGKGICAGGRFGFSGEHGRGIFSGLTFALIGPRVVEDVELAKARFADGTGTNEGIGGFRLILADRTGGRVVAARGNGMGFGFETTRGFGAADALGTSALRGRGAGGAGKIVVAVSGFGAFSDAIAGALLAVAVTCAALVTAAFDAARASLAVGTAGFGGGPALTTLGAVEIFAA